jgi:hypothetical protein
MIAPDIRELKPSLVIQLTDGVTGSKQLAGTVDVRIGSQPAAFGKEYEATFVFLDLPAGLHNVSVVSAPTTPFYLPATIPVSIPLTTELWPAFPDIALADLTKPLDDPLQPPAYRAQRELASLLPAPAYPFGPDVTLARGTVRSAGLPLAGALVRRSGDPAGFTTRDSGEFVLFFDDVPGRSQSATIVASCPGKPDVSATVTLLRAATVSLDMVMAP